MEVSVLLWAKMNFFYFYIYLIYIWTVRSKVIYNMNAIPEPSEPIGEHWKPASVTDVEAYL